MSDKITTGRHIIEEKVDELIATIERKRRALVWDVFIFLLFFLPAVCLVILGHKLGEAAGFNQGREEVRREAFRHGHGWHDLDQATGRIIFRWGRPPWRGARPDGPEGRLFRPWGRE
jgi:hypothetical protein